MDAVGKRRYLESMILLSEAADKIRNEVTSWPGKSGRVPVFRYDPDLKDAREGDERLLIEILGIAIGLISSGDGIITVSLSGNDRQVFLKFSGFAECPKCKDRNWDSLRRKAAHWTPEISLLDKTLHLTLGIPSSLMHPPMDVDAMAAETGIQREEALMIVGGFVKQGRRYLEQLRSSRQETDRFRAAHSLKGAGKTLRAPELAAAARRVERTLKEQPDDNPDISGLETAWQRIENWYMEAGKL